MSAHTKTIRTRQKQSYQEQIEKRSALLQEKGLSQIDIAKDTILKNLKAQLRRTAAAIASIENQDRIVAGAREKKIEHAQAKAAAGPKKKKRAEAEKAPPAEGKKKKKAKK